MRLSGNVSQETDYWPASHSARYTIRHLSTSLLFADCMRKVCESSSLWKNETSSASFPSAGWMMMTIAILEPISQGDTGPPLWSHDQRYGHASLMMVIFHQCAAGLKSCF